MMSPPVAVRVGVHVSIAGGLTEAVRRARALSCETMQVFSKSPRGWAARPLDQADAEQAAALRARFEIRPFAVHASYLINLASADPALAARSTAGLVEELDRAAFMQADYVVVHVGCVRDGESDGVERVAMAISRVLDRYGADVPGLLLENTAGERGEVGSRFEELAEVLHRVDDPRVGICLDTCHTLAAGYELRTPAAVSQLLGVIRGTVGLSSLKLIHANDSKQGLGSHVDRHEHIGQGAIGRAGFRAFLGAPELRTVPLVLETPKRSKTDDTDDRNNLRTIRRLAQTSLTTVQRCRRSTAKDRASSM